MNEWIMNEWMDKEYEEFEWMDKECEEYEEYELIDKLINE